MSTINKTMRIGEILALDYSLAPVLMDMGMHCLGCPASQMETLEEACQVHDVDADQIVALLNQQLNGEA